MNCQRVYDQLIHRAQVRESVSGYSETHHIIPRAHDGSDLPTNLVQLTAREHFITHWLLWRIHRDRSTARAFRLLTDTNGKPRSRAYESAKLVYAESMKGESNVAKRPEVQAKISAALCASHPYTGKKRPQHAAMMRSRGLWVGQQNPWYGTGERQLGTNNPMARGVRGTHPVHGTTVWETSVEAAKSIGVSPQAICQALRRSGASRGWKLEYAA